jgi:hypothetical protein
MLVYPARFKVEIPDVRVMREYLIHASTLARESVRGIAGGRKKRSAAGAFVSTRSFLTTRLGAHRCVGSGTAGSEGRSAGRIETGMNGGCGGIVFTGFIVRAR